MGESGDEGMEGGREGVKGGGLDAAGRQGVEEGVNMDVRMGLGVEGSGLGTAGLSTLGWWCITRSGRSVRGLGSGSSRGLGRRMGHQQGRVWVRQDL